MGAKHTPGPASQWPDNITTGDICYGKAANYYGFYLADVQHGIPTIGAVASTSPVTIHGQNVEIFNYPGQTEAIAKALCDRWNAFAPMLAALKKLDAFWTEWHAAGPDGDPTCMSGLATISDDTLDVWRQVRAAIAKAEAA